MASKISLRTREETTSIEIEVERTKTRTRTTRRDRDRTNLETRIISTEKLSQRRTIKNDKLL